MSEYTPTTNWLRIIVGYAMTTAADRTKPVEEARAEGYERFDRWLAAHDREVAAKAWGEGWNTGWDGRLLHDHGVEGHAEAPNPYISALVSEPSTPEGETP